MKFAIPRNVKRGQTFMGLEWRGWFMFTLSLPLIIGVGWSVYTLLNQQAVGIIIAGAIAGAMYFLFSTDERTGSLNVSFLLNFLKWTRSKKIQIFKEDLEHGNIKALQTKVKVKES